MEALIECMEQVGNSPYDVNLYPRYIKLAGEQDNAARNESTNDRESVSEREESDELGPLGAEACGTMTSAMAATSGRCLPTLIVATLFEHVLMVILDRRLATVSQVSTLNPGRVEQT
jgi:hypothetical protein